MLLAFPVGLIVGPVTAIVGAFIGIGLVYLMGMLLRIEEWDFLRLFRPAAYGYLAEGADPHAWGASTVIDEPGTLLVWLDAASGARAS